jgi:hypothetical protein
VVVFDSLGLGLVEISGFERWFGEHTQAWELKLKVLTLLAFLAELGEW